jgi:hypothetical protein
MPLFVRKQTNQMAYSYSCWGTTQLDALNYLCVLLFFNILRMVISSSSSFALSLSLFSSSFLPLSLATLGCFAPFLPKDGIAVIASNQVIASITSGRQE